MDSKVMAKVRRIRENLEVILELCEQLEPYAKKEEADCHNCGYSVWYTREDGEKTWLCTKGQPKESVRVTLPNLLCEDWVRK